VTNIKLSKTDLQDVLIIEPKIFTDERGFFQETWNKKDFSQAIGRSVDFCQDNHSHSVYGVLRGLHYQLMRPQCKLIRVLRGAVLDVVVDIRKSSPTFGKHIAVRLTESNHKQLWIPEGFAHGFFALTATVDFLYKVTEDYNQLDEHCILWNDLSLKINWRINGTTPKISEKDRKGELFQDATVFQ